MESSTLSFDGQLELPSLPAVTMRLNTLLAEGLPSMGEVARLVGEDPALATKVLRLVNSPLYPFRAQIDSLPRAVALLGVRELRSLALSAAVVDLFEVTAFQPFWRHSLYTALLCRALAEAAQQRELDRFFTIGLLHDIGALVILQQLPAQAASIQERAAAGTPVLEAEQQVLGFDHCQVGAQLLRFWALPDAIVAAVEDHHAPRLRPEYRLEKGIVALANQLAGLQPEGARTPGPQLGPVVSDWEWINVNQRWQHNIVSTATERLAATHRALFAGAPAVAPTDV